MLVYILQDNHIYIILPPSRRNHYEGLRSMRANFCQVKRFARDSLIYRNTLNHSDLFSCITKRTYMIWYGILYIGIDPHTTSTTD